jgi:hypothetical protein
MLPKTTSVAIRGHREQRVSAKRRDTRSAPTSRKQAAEPTQRQMKLGVNLPLIRACS